MPIFGEAPNRDKFRTYAWSLCWMLCHGKTEEDAIASLKRRFSWLNDEVIAVALTTAKQWIKNADRVNAIWKRGQNREQAS